MSRATLRLVLIVSCAHAMVHIYELSLPSVEELVAGAYGVDKRMTGALSNCWRFPWGLGALLAGWLVDRYGAKWLLVIYLLGCAGTSALVSCQPTLAVLFAAMFSMGAFASIYHPAGLALISHETRPEDRTTALGYHGILGSLGIAAAPFLGGLVLTYTPWHGYYLALVLPGVALAAVIALWLKESGESRAESGEPSSENGGTVPASDRPSGSPLSALGSPLSPGSPLSALGPPLSNWRAFRILIFAGMLNGFVYAALMSFLPRYLGGLSLRPEDIPDRSFKNYVTGVVLLTGIVGQFWAGRMGRTGSLERQLAIIFFALSPLLLGMAVAEGSWRILAACSVSLVIFMQQPIYNALVAQYVPRQRRSLGFGISNALAFGVGSFGALCAGLFQSDLVNFSCLAGVAALSGGIAVALLRDKTEERKVPDSAGPSGE